MKKLVAYSVTGEEVKLCNTNPKEEVDEQTYRKVRELTSALKNLMSGFEIIMENVCRYILTPRQLKFFICGRDELSAEQLISRLNFIEGESYAKSFKWVVEQLTSEERILLLKFATGRVSIPVAGSGASLTLNVSFNKPCGKNPPYSLPVAATCSSTIDVPCYPTKEIMLERIRVAIHFGSDMTLDTDMQVSRRVFE